MATVKKKITVEAKEPPKLPTFLRRSFGNAKGSATVGPKHPVKEAKVSVAPVHLVPMIQTGHVRPTTTSPVGAAVVQQERQIARNRTNSASLHTRVLQASRDARAAGNSALSRETNMTRVNPPRATLDRATGRTGFANAFSRTDFRSGGQVSYNMRRAQGV